MRKAIIFLLFVMLLSGVQAAEREWQAIEIPDARCGDGSQYSIYASFSNSSRVVIWLPGGDSTLMENGNLSTPIEHVDDIYERIHAPIPRIMIRWLERGEESLFIDHPDNDGFVKDANWVILPYCTQDFHSGNLDAVEYDFTGQEALRGEIEMIVNRIGKERFEENFPFIRIQGQEINGSYYLDELYISILHQGANNVQRGIDRLFEILISNGFVMEDAEVLISGSSAGGFGVWYNAWRIGDLLYEYPNAKFTIVPQAGSPILRFWKNGDIELNRILIEDITHKTGYFRVKMPCDVCGGNYNSSGERCDDALGLLDHYLFRYKDRDVEFLAVINKEDALGVAELGEGEPGFQQRLEAFCKTMHRYSQYVELTNNSQAYAGWLYERKGRNIVRVHGFKDAALITRMLNANGGGASEYGLLKYMNAVASRAQRDGRMIENTMGIIVNPRDLNSRVIARPDYMQECNVEWPERRRP